MPRRNIERAKTYWGICLTLFLVLFVDRAAGLGGHDPVAGLLTACLLGLIPLPFHVGLIYWLDRMEPEPPNLIWESFLWGATGAVVLAFILEMIGESLVALYTQDRATLVFFGASVNAPVIEEVLKAAVLFSIFKRHPDDFENIADGIIYAAMVGIGFAAIENIFYYESQWVKSGLTGTVNLFGVRGVLAGYNHPLFTSLTGIGLGIAAKKGKGILRIEPLLGLIGAILLHSFWNCGGPAYAVIYGLVTLLVFRGILYDSVRSEEAFLREHLKPELHNGHLSQTQYEQICDGKTRLRAVLDSLIACRFKTCGKLRAVQLAARELAFHRYRVAIQGVATGPVEMKRERAYLNALCGPK